MSILKVVFSGDTTQLDKALTKTQRKLEGFSKSAKSIGTKMSIGLTAPIVAAGGAAIKLASDFQESLNKVDVAFKDTSGQVKSFAKTALNSFGIAEGTALDMAALFGDMSTSMGLTTGEAAKMSTALVGLAGDLSSFKNMNIEEVTTALNGVFTGETESLKRLGVVMTETNLQQFALSQGIQKNIKDFTQAEKTLLRYEYVMGVTANAHGDFARTGGGAANQMRVFQESLKDLGVQFGDVMLPIFTDVVKKLNELIKGFKDLSFEQKQNIIEIAGLTAVIGPVLIALGSMAGAMEKLIKAGRFLHKIMGSSGLYSVLSKFGPVGGIIAAAVGAAVYAINEGTKKIAPDVSVWERLGIAFGNAARQNAGGKNLAIEELEKAQKRAVELKETLDVLDKRRPGPQNQNVSRVPVPQQVIQAPKLQGMDLLSNSAIGEYGKLADRIAAEAKARPLLEPLKLTSTGVKKVTQTWDELPRSLGPTIANTEAIIAKNLDNTFVLIEDGQIAAMDKLAALNSGITDILNQGLQGMVVGVASALGAAAAGAEGGIGALSKVLLGGIADMAIQLGQLAIGVGLTIEAIKKSLENLGPGAILAGIALVALGSFVKGQAAKIGAGQGGDRGRSSMPAFANGGIVSGPTIGLMGEYPGAKSNPEVIAPLDKLQSMLNNNGGGNVNVGGEFVVRGQDLVVALQRADKTRNRIKG